MLLWTLWCTITYLYAYFPFFRIIQKFLFLIFWETGLQFSIAAEPFYIPTSNAYGFQFLHILNSTCYFLLLLLFFFFNNSYPSGCKYSRFLVTLHCLGFSIHTQLITSSMAAVKQSPLAGSHGQPKRALCLWSLCGQGVLGATAELKTCGK